MVSLSLSGLVLRKIAAMRDLDILFVCSRVASFRLVAVWFQVLTGSSKMLVISVPEFALLGHGPG